MGVIRPRARVLDGAGGGVELRACSRLGLIEHDPVADEQYGSACDRDNPVPDCYGGSGDLPYRDFVADDLQEGVVRDVGR